MKYNVVICAIVKNDNDYLDEWIKYYTDLGICKIYIYEYFNSVSHEALCQKYSDVVYNEIKNIQGVSEFKKITDNRVSLYQHFANTYKNKYDWCLFIDVNDFLQIENGETLDSILGRYSLYNGVGILWKLYGANGHLKKPEGNIIDTYKKEIDYINNISNKNVTCSLLVNLKSETLRIDNGRYVNHMISTKKKYFKNINDLSYKHIWINRYITKSFVEWADRIINGDYVGDYLATFKRFFFINKDMKGLENDALNLLEEKEQAFKNNQQDYAMYIHTHKVIPNRIPTDCHYIITASNRNVTSDTHEVIYIDDEFTKKHQIGYGEACTMHYLWKHPEILPEYVGLNHYRRFFVRLYDSLIPMKEIVNEYGAIIPHPYHHSSGTNSIIMRITHMKKDADLIDSIVLNNFQKYANAYNEMKCDTYQYACNIFAMKKEDFIEMCDFVFGVMEEYDKIMGFTDDTDVYNYVVNGKGSVWTYSNVDWQKRLEGFWVEWLTETYYRYKFNVDKAFNGRFYLIQEDDRKKITDNTLLVSLTTWKERIDHVDETLLSLKNAIGNYDAKIILVLSNEEFTKKDLSDKLLRVLDYCDVEVIWDEGNIKSHKKLIPTLEKYPNNRILVCDDDKIYPKDFIQKFIETNELYPSDVIVGGTFLDMIPRDGHIYLNNVGYPNNPHESLEELYVSKPANGLYGTLYPPHTFTDRRFFDRNLIKTYSETSDEDWQFLFNVLENRTLRIVNNVHKHVIKSSVNENMSPLHKINTFEKYEERHNKFIELFPNYYDKLLERYNKKNGQ